MLMSRKNQLLLEFSFWNEPVPREGPNIYELRSYQLRVSNSSRSSSRRQQCESSGMDHIRLFSLCFYFETQLAITEQLTALSALLTVLLLRLLLSDSQTFLFSY